MLREMCTAATRLPQLEAILPCTACRLSPDFEARTLPVVPSFLEPFLCALISCGDVTCEHKTTQMTATILGQFEFILPVRSLWNSAVMTGGFRWIGTSSARSVALNMLTRTTGRSTLGIPVVTRWDLCVVIQPQKALAQQNIISQAFAGLSKTLGGGEDWVEGLELRQRSQLGGKLAWT